MSPPPLCPLPIAVPAPPVCPLSPVAGQCPRRGHVPADAGLGRAHNGLQDPARGQQGDAALPLTLPQGQSGQGLGPRTADVAACLGLGGAPKVGRGQTSVVRVGKGRARVVRVGVGVLAGVDVHVVGGSGEGCSDPLPLRPAWRASATLRQRGATPLLVVLRPSAAVVVVPGELSPSPPPAAHPGVVRRRAAALWILVGAVVIPRININTRVGIGHGVLTSWLMHGRGRGADLVPGLRAATGVGGVCGRRGGGDSPRGTGAPYRRPGTGLPAVGRGGGGAGRLALAGVRRPLPQVAVGVGQDVRGAQAAVHQAVLETFLLARLGRTLRQATPQLSLTDPVRQADRQTSMQTDREASRQTGRPTGRRTDVS